MKSRQKHSHGNHLQLISKLNDSFSDVIEILTNRSPKIILHNEDDSIQYFASQKS